MIRLVICKTARGGTDVPPDFPFLTELISKTGSEKLKRERIAAYLTLKCSYERFFGTPLPALRKSEMGRTELDERCGHVCDFNISHTDGLCAVAYLDEDGRIGVDAEEEREADSHSKIADRFLKNVNISSQKHVDRIEIVLAEAVASEIRFLDTATVLTGKECGTVSSDPCDSKASLSLVTSDDFFSRWGTLEAVLKADGGGFSSFSSFDELIKRAEVIHFRLVTCAQVYRISLARLL